MPPPLNAAARLGVRYREASGDDLPFLAAVYASTRMEELAPTGWPEEGKQRFLAQQFEAQHRHYRQHYLTAEWLVIERGGKPVGRLYIDEWPQEVRLIDIALLPEARGEGVGGAVLADAMEQAAAAGKPLTIHVERNNPALRLYRRLGFDAIGEHGIYLLMEWRPETVSTA
ncbi:MAG TPA: GNAT family N-acetyltransferase [Allosphingosinicella sp.]|jgi:ribosomal protein S18 acetylase RimI-like enzyme